MRRRKPDFADADPGPLAAASAATAGIVHEGGRPETEEHRKEGDGAVGHGFGDYSRNPHVKFI